MKKEHAGSIIFLLAGAYGLNFSMQLPLGKWNRPGPGVFPLSLSLLLCLSGVLGFILTKRSAEGRTDWHELAKKWLTPLKILGLTGAFIVGLNQLGYLVTTSLYIFFLLFWVSRYRLWISVALAIVIGIGSSLFFEKLLAVQLPGGLLAIG